MAIEKMKQYFAPEGLLKDVFHSYEYRGEQLSMAEAVMRSIDEEKALIVEAGTGVGKSMAYLIPICSAVLQGLIQRAIVSTYTKALQRQLVEKDLPLIKEKLMPEITYRLCLGSENYLCRRRLHIAVDTGNVDIFEEDGFNELLKWKETTEEGLLLELSPPLSLWKKVCRESDLC
ncbi:MAG: DEAD/DEAH box helicase, partial [Nitrospirae bacterium]|nr:DEAD/DEAH box helicase [Nitrospirota bacterium]